MTLQRILVILRARHRLVGVVFLVTVGITVLVNLMIPKQYTASVSVVVGVKTDPIAGAVLPDVASLNYLANQIEIIQNDRVAARAVKLLGTERARSAAGAKENDTKNAVSLEYRYGALLQKKLQVAALHGSNILVLSFTGHDPELAAAVANAFAQAYVDTTIELRVEPARQYAAWFDQRQTSLRGALESAQSRLSAYQKEKGIVASDERYDQETARLTALSEKLTEIQGQKIETSSRARNSGNESSPDVLENPLVQGIKLELSKAETKLGEMSTYAGKNYPQRVQLESQIDELRQQLSKEIRRISGGAATANRSNAQQEAALTTLIEAQKKRMLSLRSERDDIAVLTKDVETARQAYEAVAQRMSQLDLESRSEQANLSILSPAIPPAVASRPKLLLNLLASLSGGLLLGAILAVGAELRDRRVRTVLDLALDDGIPLLGVLQAQGRPRAMRPLLATIEAPLVFKRSDPA